MCHPCRMVADPLAMADEETKRSASFLGQALGLTGEEMNRLLKDRGLLAGEPGAYALTEKGQQFANERYEERGNPGGSSQYFRQWPVVTWPPSVINELDVTEEQKQQVRVAARLARQEKAALRAAEAVDLSSQGNDRGAPSSSGVDSRVVVLGLLAAGAAVYGLYKAVPRIKARRADRARTKSASRMSGEGGAGSGTPRANGPAS
jgi:hypothetical protein